MDVNLSYFISTALLIIIVQTIVFGGILLFLKLPQFEGEKRYHKARKILCGSYLFLSLCYAIVFLNFTQIRNFELFNLLFTTGAAIQQIILYLSITSVPQPSFVTKRRIGIESCLMIMFFLPAYIAYFNPYLYEHTYRTLFIFCVVYFILKSTHSLYRFNIFYRKAKESIDNFFSSTESMLLVMAHKAAIIIYCMGMLVIIIIFIPSYTLDSILLIGVYISSIYYFALFVNYWIYYQRIEPVLVEVVQQPLDTERSLIPNPETKLEQNKLEDRYQVIGMALKSWVNQKRYLQAGITIEDVSADIGTNRSYLSPYINEVLGFRFTDWIMRLRMEEAKDLLVKHPSTPLQIIAEQVGINSDSNFVTHFKRIVGMSPGAYRKYILRQSLEE